MCGLRAVLPNGEIMELGGKVVKNVTGYNLIQLLTGSEGTLAVVTRILLRLLPKPEQRVDLLVPFDNFQAAGKSVSDIIKARIVPVALEFMERDSVLAVEILLHKEVRIGEICLENGAIDVLVADNNQMRDRLWETRKMIIEALQNLSPQHIMDTQDIVVPRTQLPHLLPKIKEVGERYELPIVCFGHAGDGNVHVNIIKDVPEEVWESQAPKAAEEIYRLAVSLGGMVTGEHGIGLTRKSFLSLGIDQAQIEIMRKIKEDFDPNGILNPGKIFS